MTSPRLEERAPKSDDGRKTERGGAHEAGRPSFLWSLPALLYFALFALLPLIFAFYLSFTSYNGIRLAAPVFVGLDNWIRLFNDPGILRSVTVTILLVILAVITQVPLGLLIGAWAAGPQRWRAVVVSLYFIPLLMSTAAVSVLWSSLIDPNFGLPAALPWLFGDGNLLGHQETAVGVIVFIYLWGASPLYILIFQGAARTIPPVLYQAAELDGAGRMRQFFSITVPQLRNTIVTVTILVVVGTFTAFDIILILTRGGPSNGTAILPYYMYQQAFVSFDLGYGSVIAIVLVILSALVSLLMVRVTGYDKMDSAQEGVS